MRDDNDELYGSISEGLDSRSLKYKDINGGACHYEVFEFEGQFCHESKNSSTTPQLMEVLGGMGETSVPERVQVTFRSLETKQTFTAFVEMKLIRIEDHRYHRTDDKGQKRNRKDAKKNKRFLGHLDQYKNMPRPERKPPAKPRRTNIPINEWG